VRRGAGLERKGWWARAGLGALLIGATCPLAARATDGVIEINQADVLAGGVTPGDAPGYPLTINASGSYRLTGNLDVTGLSGAVLAIEIVAPAREVVLDLGGFSVAGVGVCAPNAGTGTSCSFSGLNNGIGSTTDADVVIRNGTIRGLRTGILITTARSATIEDVRAVEHSNTGVFATSGIPTVVRRVVASVIQGRGIDIGSAGHVYDSVADHDSNNGIFAAEVSGSTASANGANGIDASFVGARVHESRAFGNGARGISLGSGGLASMVSAHENAVGIFAAAGSSVVSSTMRNNTSFGLSAAADTTYSGCTLTGNNGGGNAVQVNSGVQLGQNFCGTDLVCP